MTNEIKVKLGSELSVAIEKELNELKKSDRMLLSDIVAVVKRSDALFGKPEEDCDDSKESIYAIFNPSRYSFACTKDFGARRNKNSNIVLMSFNYFIEQVLEFNFTYLTLLQSQTFYQTVQFEKLGNLLNVMIYEDYHKGGYEHFRTDYNVGKALYRKLVSLMLGVLGDVQKGKFKEPEQLEAREFLLFVVIQVASKLVWSGYKNFSLVDCIDYDKYRIFRSQSKETRIRDLCSDVDSLNRLQDFEFDKEDAFEFTITTKFKFMQDIAIAKLY